ncbi:hypothetical protein N9N28_15025 [Rubripirellula amarantea]|nr:hypothetical protein [Rubripirellula amarantea]
MPRLQNGMSVIPTPGKGYPSSYSSVREYGWPATTLTERFSIEHPRGSPPETRYSSLDHAMRRHDISVNDSDRTTITGWAINFVFFAVMFILATIAVQALLERMFSLRGLLGTVTCLAIVMGLLSYTWSLPRPDPFFGIPRLDPSVWSTKTGE